MRAIHRKLLRDVRHLRGQVLAIAVVVACGVATVVTTRTAYESLVVSQAAYYAGYRFADVFANLERAPEALRSRIEALPGVAAVETRVVAEVTLDVPGLGEPATGRLISLPERDPPRLNGIHLRRGRRLEPGRPEEVLVSEAFAEANRLEVGDRIGAVLNGRWEELRIVGVALSPEYVYEIRGTDLFPDNRRFGVLWMSRAALGPAFDLEGAFNDVSLRLAPGAVEDEVISRLDVLLEPYGGLGAYGRADQVSHSFLADEIAQNRVSGTVLPAVFLGVAAFLLNLVLARLVSTQRDQIAVLKAFGYEDRTVARHYLGFAAISVALGAAAGTPLGLWLGWLINGLYVRFYRFPVLRFDPGVSVVALAIAVSAAAALIGAQSALRRVLSLPPAEAMRPEPPARFQAGLLERTRLARWLPTPPRMIWRNVARRPVRSALAVLGIALAVSILVVGRYFVDAIQLLAELQFRTVQREDVTLAFREPLPASARFAVASMPGVLRSEPFRIVPARLRFEHATRRVPLIGLQPTSELRRLVDSERAVYAPPLDGLVLTSRLARILGVSAGDEVQVEVLEGERPVRRIAVAGDVDEQIGLSAYLDARALARLLREEGSVSGAFLRVDAAAADDLNTRLKRLPAVAGATTRLAALQSFESTVAESFSVFNTVLVLFACAIAAAMVYNAARIALSERGRELASLRVLGFTRREIAVLLLGEQALLTVLALPVGFAIGYEMCQLIGRAYQRELFAIPLIVTGHAYLFALTVVLVSAIGSGWLVRRRLDRLDLVAVLKTRE
jgi:putative ABC transport system permease protein